MNADNVTSNAASVGRPISKWSEVSVGDLVRLADGRLVLVGDVNSLGGLCDDCMEQSAPVAVVSHLGVPS